MGRKQVQFAALAQYYDRFNGADYSGYTEYICEVFRRHGSGKENLILDLACGTGKLTEKLAEAGFDMIGADISSDMLSVAMQSAFEGKKNILYLNQDMRSFELYGTVSAVVCALDGVSYLYDEEDVVKCFKLVRNYLDPGGLFLFDINSPYRFKEVFAKRDFFLEEKGLYLGWKSNFHPKSGVCDFFLTLFSENSDGSYEKYEEEQSEKMWEKADILRIAEKSGLEFVALYGDMSLTEAKETDEKNYYVLRCPLNK